MFINICYIHITQYNKDLFIHYNVQIFVINLRIVTIEIKCTKAY